MNGSGRASRSPRCSAAVAADSARRRAEAFLRRSTEHPRTGRAPGATGPADESGETSRLAIPGYETLAAAEIVSRLAGLTPRELAAVRAFEEAHRARRTVLTRIAQLLGDQDR